MVAGATAVYFSQSQPKIDKALVSERPVEATILEQTPPETLEQTPPATLPEPEVEPAPESSVNEPAPAPNYDIREGSIAELQDALEIASKQREGAEETLRVIELKVTALEAQIDDIEIRGDDPVDAQDETLDTFQAVFAEYQDTIMVFEEAAAKEEWITDKLKELEQGLEQ